MREAIARDVRAQMDAEIAAFGERLASDEFRNAVATVLGPKEGASR